MEMNWNEAVAMTQHALGDLSVQNLSKLTSLSRPCIQDALTCKKAATPAAREKLGATWDTLLGSETEIYSNGESKIITPADFASGCMEWLKGNKPVCFVEALESAIDAYNNACDEAEEIKLDLDALNENTKAVFGKGSHQDEVIESFRQSLNDAFSN